MTEATTKTICIGIGMRGKFTVVITPLFDISRVKQETLDATAFGLPNDHGDVIDFMDADGMPVPAGCGLVTTGNYKTAELLCNLGAKLLPMDCAAIIG